jgi:ferric-dicitrate binding protein FerR (iron transport regulator)
MDKEILYRFFDGTASHDEEKHIRQWLESSGENRRAFLRERKLFDVMILNARENAGGNHVVRRPSRVVAFMKELGKIAAVIAITFAVSYLLFQTDGQGDTPAMQTVSVPSGQRVNITLPDGTNVWLNARSSLTYPVSFNRRERVMSLDGEAYFEVARDGKKPFVVQTAHGIINVLGTHFDVDAYASADAFETTLMSGSLKVRLNGDSTGGILLAPDEKAVLKGGKLQVEHVNDYARYRWREGLICFSRASFVSIMNDFEKYYGVSVVVKNTKVAKSSYTGKFRFTDGIDYALGVLQKDIRFTYRRDNDNQVIYIE